MLDRLAGPEREYEEIAAQPVDPEVPSAQRARQTAGRPGKEREPRGPAARRAKWDRDPKGPPARYDRAMALDAANDRDGAIAELLDLIRRDRKWNEEAGRKPLGTLFEAVGPAGPRPLEARRHPSGRLVA